MRARARGWAQLNKANHERYLISCWLVSQRRLHFAMEERGGASWKGTSCFAVGEPVQLSWRNCKVSTADGDMAVVGLLPGRACPTVNNQIVLNAHCQMRPLVSVPRVLSYRGTRLGLSCVVERTCIRFAQRWRRCFLLHPSLCIGDYLTRCQHPWFKQLTSTSTLRARCKVCTSDCRTNS